MILSLVAAGALSVAGTAPEDGAVVRLLAPCGRVLVYADTGSEWRRHPARDEGKGVVSQLTEVSGDFAHRELELVDCRSGQELFVGDAMVPSGATLPLPRGTPFQKRLEALRSAGTLRDLRAVSVGFGDAGQQYAMDVDWRQNVQAACACEHFYPGTSGLPADQIPAPDQVHGYDGPALDGPEANP